MQNNIIKKEVEEDLSDEQFSSSATLNEFEKLLDDEQKDYLLKNLINDSQLKQLKAKNAKKTKPESAQVFERWTNQVLRLEFQQKYIIYFPAYLRFKIKEVQSFDLQSLKAHIDGTLIFSFYYGDMHADIYGAVIDSVRMFIARNGTINLQKNQFIKYQNNRDLRTFNYYIRKVFIMGMDTREIVWAPFEVLYMNLSVSVNEVIGTEANNNYIYKFNFMDYHEYFSKVSWNQKVAYGNYHLAEGLIKVSYTKQQNFTGRQIFYDIEDRDTNGPQTYRFAYFQFAFYRIPNVSFMKIYFPLIMLGLLNLAIFFQIPDLSWRLSALATLMLAFVALIPTIREQLPDIPIITYTEIIIFIQTGTSLLCLAQSIRVRNEDQTLYNFIWYEDILFLICAFITILTILYVIILFVGFKIRERKYVLDIKQKQEHIFRPWRWYNWSLDEEYKEYMENQKLNPFQSKFKIEANFDREVTLKREEKIEQLREDYFSKHVYNKKADQLKNIIQFQKQKQLLLRQSIWQKNKRERRNKRIEKKRKEEEIKKKNDEAMIRLKKEEEKRKRDQQQEKQRPKTQKKQQKEKESDKVASQGQQGETERAFVFKTSRINSFGSQYQYQSD